MDNTLLRSDLYRKHLRELFKQKHEIEINIRGSKYNRVIVSYTDIDVDITYDIWSRGADACFLNIETKLFDANRIKLNGLYKAETITPLPDDMKPYLDAIRAKVPLTIIKFTQPYTYLHTFWINNVGDPSEMDQFSDWLKGNTLEEYVVSGALISFKSEIDASFFALNFCY